MALPIRSYKFTGFSYDRCLIFIAWLQMIGNAVAATASTAGFLIGTYSSQNDSTTFDELDHLHIWEDRVDEHGRLQTTLILSLIIFGIGIADGILLFRGMQKKNPASLIAYIWYSAIHIICSVIVLNALSSVQAYICFGFPIFLDAVFVSMVLYYLKGLKLNATRHVRFNERDTKIALIN